MGSFSVHCTIGAMELGKLQLSIEPDRWLTMTHHVLFLTLAVKRKLKRKLVASLWTQEYQ